MITIYHNPRCSKSRESLTLVSKIAADRHLQLVVVDYQKTPLSPLELAELQRQLQLPLQAMVRDNEQEHAALGLADADDATLLQAMSTHPTLLQRPIVVHAGRAAIGRPPEHILRLFATEQCHP